MQVRERTTETCFPARRSGAAACTLEAVQGRTECRDSHHPHYLLAGPAGVKRARGRRRARRCRMLHTDTAGQAEHHQAVHQRHCVCVCTYQECAMPLRWPEFRMNENNGRGIAWAVGPPVEASLEAGHNA